MLTGKALTTKLPSPMRMMPKVCCSQQTTKPSTRPSTTAMAQMSSPSARKARRMVRRSMPMERRMKMSSRLLMISSDSDATRLSVEMSTMSDSTR